MISLTEFKRLADLAKLSFSDGEALLFIEKLKNVTKMIDTLRDLDCNEVEPLRSVCDSDQRTVHDEVKVGDISEQIFANVPEKGNSSAKEIKCFVVPKAVE